MVGLSGEAVFEGVPEGLVLCRRDTGEVLAVNRRFRDITGLSADEVEGRPLRAVDRLRPVAGDGAHPVGVDAGPVQWTVQNADGAPIPLSLSVGELAADGDEYHLVSVRRETGDDDGPVPADGPERAGLEERLRMQNDRLAMLNRLVRHDIRNEMAVALGWLENVQTEFPEEGRADLERVVGACERTVRLTELSRDLTNVIVGEAGLTVEPTDLSEVVRTEVAKARQAFEHAEITTSGEIPAVAVEANPLLSSVLANLLNNAVQHNDEETPEVTIDVERLGETVRVRVADNGPGIPPGVRDALFERGETALDNEGTGLGLYLVGTLVDIFGGDVWVEDNDPTGTVVVVELNVARREEKPA